MSRKTLTKAEREQIFEKYNHHCAYCGCELKYEEMQVDHVDAVHRAVVEGRNVDNSLENFLPACRSCNFYKSDSTIEQFRENLTGMLVRNIRRSFDYRLALKYGLIEEHIQPVTFYFEQV